MTGTKGESYFPGPFSGRMNITNFYQGILLMTFLFLAILPFLFLASLSLLGGVFEDTPVIYPVLPVLVIYLYVVSFAIRRLHDVGKGGWWTFILLIPVVNLFLFILWGFRRGMEGTNQYGSPPSSKFDSKFILGFRSASEITQREVSIRQEWGLRRKIVNKVRIVIMILVLVVAGGYYLYGHFYRSPLPVVPDGWIEYRNEALGFRIAYPEDWERIMGKGSGEDIGLRSPELQAEWIGWKESEDKTAYNAPSPYANLGTNYWKSLENLPGLDREGNISQNITREGKILEQREIIARAENINSLRDYLFYVNLARPYVAELESDGTFIRIGDLRAYECEVLNLFGGRMNSYCVMIEGENGIYRIEFLEKSKEDLSKTEIDILNSFRLIK